MEMQTIPVASVKLVGQVKRRNKMSYIINSTQYVFYPLHFMSCNWRDSFQAGELRNRDEIVQNLQDQLHCAAHGVAQDVSNMQTETGTKDKITQHWIDILLEKAKEMKKKDPGLRSWISGWWALYLA